MCVGGRFKINDKNIWIYYGHHGNKIAINDKECKTIKDLKSELSNFTKTELILFITTEKKRLHE